MRLFFAVIIVVALILATGSLAFAANIAASDSSNAVTATWNDPHMKDFNDNGHNNFRGYLSNGIRAMLVSSAYNTRPYNNNGRLNPNYETAVTTGAFKYYQLTNTTEIMRSINNVTTYPCNKILTVRVGYQADSAAAAANFTTQPALPNPERYPVDSFAIDQDTSIGSANYSQKGKEACGIRARVAESRVWRIFEFCADCHDGNADTNPAQSLLISKGSALRNQSNTSESPKSREACVLSYQHDSNPQTSACRIRFNPKDSRDFGAKCRTRIDDIVSSTVSDYCSNNGFIQPHRTLSRKMLKDDLFGLDFDGTAVAVDKIWSTPTEDVSDGTPDTDYDTAIAATDLSSGTAYEIASVCPDCHNPIIRNTLSTGYDDDASMTEEQL